MDNPAAPLHAALRDIISFASDRLAQVELPELESQPLDADPPPPDVEADRKRAIEAANKVVKACGAPALVAMLQANFETNKVSEVNPGHFNHLVGLCDKMVADVAGVDPLAE